MSLHTDGFMILPGALEFTEIQISQLKTKFELPRRKDSIFNETESSASDGKRFQKNISTRNSVYPLIRDFFKEMFPALMMRNLTALCSLPGCQPQAAHCDYIPTLELLDTADEEIPLVSIIAIEDGTRIDIWEKSHQVIRGFHREKVPRKTVLLNRGDVLVFRADCVHAGSGYDEKNVRVHCFLDSPSIARVPNVTWKIYQRAPSYVRRWILV